MIGIIFVDFWFTMLTRKKYDLLTGLPISAQNRFLITMIDHCFQYINLTSYTVVNIL